MFYNIIKCKFNIFSCKWCSVTPRMSFYYFKTKTHPVFFWHSNQGTFQKFLFSFFHWISTFIISKYNRFSFALFLPLFFSWVKVFIPIHTTLLFWKCSCIFHKSICKSKWIFLHIYRCINTTIWKCIGFSFYIIYWCRN